MREVCIAIKLYCEVQWQGTRLPVSRHGAGRSRRARGRAGPAGQVATSAQGAQAGTGRANGRCELAAGSGSLQGAGAAGARGAGARGAGPRARTVGARQQARGARPGCWASGLGARAGYGLCTRCTRPVFDPV